MKLSLVIPCYNEQENVPTLLQRVEASLNKIGRPFEVLIIDDGSSDDTPKLLAEAMQKLPWLRVIRMVKNSGEIEAFPVRYTVAKSVPSLNAKCRYPAGLSDVFP